MRRGRVIPPRYPFFYSLLSSPLLSSPLLSSPLLSSPLLSSPLLFINYFHPFLKKRKGEKEKGKEKENNKELKKS
jgi:hypothetical protein